MLQLLASNHIIDLVDSIVVGDSWRDSMLAKSVGARFVHVGELSALDDPGQVFRVGASS
jgi:histidinol phosphatase-like enzyme